MMQFSGKVVQSIEPTSISVAGKLKPIITNSSALLSWSAPDFQIARKTPLL